MIRLPALALFAFAAVAVPVGARAHSSSSGLEPVTAASGTHVPSSPPILILPAGGAEFRRAVLEWSALPVATVPGDLLEMPVDAVRLSSRFGVRHDPMGAGVRAHQGIDIPDRTGAPVHAAAGGVVVFAGWSRGYGNLVQIDHGGGNETRYGHLAAIAVDAGTRLPQGTLIGLVGSTGRSTGPHLHFEVRQDGVAVDPLLRLGSAVSVSSTALAGSVRQSWSGFGEDATALPQSRLR